MAVFVDDPRIAYRRMKMCHMVADSLNELHNMARRIGVKRKWFQNKPGKPHYDICISKRKLAIDFGALPVDGREIIKILKRNQSGL